MPTEAERGPFTVGQMVELAAQHLLDDGLAVNPADACFRAQVAIGRCIRDGLLREWGYTQDGDVLYETHTPAVIIIDARGN